MATPTTLPSTFTAGQVLTAAQMNNLRGAFRVLQIVSTAKTDTFTTTSTTFADVTGLSVSITPSATSSKILVIAQVVGMSDHGVTSGWLQMVRGSTAIDVGDVAGSRIPTSGTLDALGATSPTNVALCFLDSPATTSATTYKIQIRNVGAGTMYINRGKTDTDANTIQRTASTITVFEVSA